MKSILLLPFVILFTSISLFSQDENQSKYAQFSFGTELGVMYGTPIGPSDKGSTISVGTAPNDVLLTLDGPSGRPGLGLRVGVFGRYQLIEKLGIQIGLAYAAKKANYSAPAYDQDYTDIQEVILPNGNPFTIVTPTYFNGNVKGEFNNKYLEVPFVVLYDLSEKWKVQGGGYTAMLLSGSHEVWATGIVGNNFLEIENEYKDESSAISTWDYGLNAGVSYKVFRQIETEFRISSGLRSVFRDDYTLKEETIRNIYMELKANYIFEL